MDLIKLEFINYMSTFLHILPVLQWRGVAYYF